MANQRISMKDVIISVGPGNIIGGSEELAATFSADNEEAYEAGNYFPVEIVDGKKHIIGTLTRAWIDNETINTLFPPDAGIWPVFTLTGTVVSGKSPSRTVNISGVKFDSVDINGFTLDSYAKNAMPFKATNIKFS